MKMHVIDEFEAAKKEAIEIVKNGGAKTIYPGEGLTKVDRIHLWMQQKVPGFNPEWYDVTAREILEEATK